MASVVAALIADHALHFFGEEVSDLALAFITPLGTDEATQR